MADNEHFLKENVALTEVNLAKFNGEGIKRPKPPPISLGSPSHKEEPDLINLETPKITSNSITYDRPILTSESSVTSFTTLAENRTKRSRQEMESLDEDKIVTELNLETAIELEIEPTQAKSEDQQTAQSKEAPAKMSSKPQVLPRKNRPPNSASTSENPATLGSPATLESPATQESHPLLPHEVREESPLPKPKPKPKPRQTKISETEQTSSQCGMAEVSQVTQEHNTSQPEKQLKKELENSEAHNFAVISL